MKKLLFVVGLALALCACGSKLNIVMKENITLEYGEEADQALLFDKDKSEEKLTVKEIKDYDNKKLGEQAIRVIFALEDKVQEEKVKVNVKDTKAPEIKLKKDKLEITEGDQFDPASNIESVKDPIDGEIKRSNDKKLTKNGYLITSEVDTKKVKDGYKVKVTAYDQNGNKAEKTYTVNVKAKPEEPKQNTVQSTYTEPAQSTGGTGYAAPSAGGSTGTYTPQPQPQEPPKTCTVPDNQLGNSGMRFATEAEAFAWAEEQIRKDQESGELKYGPYGVVGIDDTCDNRVGYTVVFSYVK